MQSHFVYIYLFKTKTGTKLLIKNCVADTNLAVMNQNWMTTFFGPVCIYFKSCVQARATICRHIPFIKEAIFCYKYK